ncbi:GGDEF domain-containing response regulator [Candidatus Viridilinea mediisalina]|uniref:GGDEF domain-containing response regulator n=1 Tax=Candidatus Viridilinea mediisalina TaxID=2024553 RepID=UPI0013FD3E1D|nr:response regulator [Candidatus Viridilinea mediisalina]
MSLSHATQFAEQTTNASPRILLADDDMSFCQLMSILLGHAGYHLIVVNNGHDLVRTAQEERPDLLLIDLVMPNLDGYEALRQLRNDSRTAHLPIMILSARSDASDLVCGFETGADDYITKPVTNEELLARIRGQLRRANRRPVHSPLTGLPGNALLIEEIRYRIQRKLSFALLHLDLTNFKAFNDTYGFARGDQAIHLLANLLRERTTNESGSFVGHIGGDDFALLCMPERAIPLAHAIIAQFTQVAPNLYDEAHRLQGCIEAQDREGVLRRFALMGLVIGGAIQTPGRFQTPESISHCVAVMKQFAKQHPTSAFVVSLADHQPPLTGP